MSNEVKVPDPEPTVGIVEPQVDAGILKALEGASPTLIVVTILFIVLGKGLFSFLNRREDLIHEREMAKLERKDKSNE